MRVVFVSADDAVSTVVGRGFMALPHDARVILTEETPEAINGLNGSSAALLEVPLDLLRRFERDARTEGRRTFEVPPCVPDPFPILAYRGRDRVTRSRGVSKGRLAGAGAVLLVCLGAILAFSLADDAADKPSPTRASPAPPSAPSLIAPSDSADRTPRPADPTPRAAVAGVAQSGRDSKAVGSPEAGSLIRGVALQAEGQNHFTWDLPRGRSPNPRFRRYATSSVVRRTLKVVAAYSRAHPRAARVGIADLSLRRGGTFGLRYGGTGHVNHQNGTEADVLYPRRDGKERVALGRQVDKRLAQNLVNRFLRAGAVLVLVDSELALEGPPGRLDTAAFHDDHMHVRFAPR